MIVHKCDRCGQDILEPDYAPSQDDKVFCSTVCKARFTIQRQADPDGRSTPPVVPNPPRSASASTDAAAKPRKKTALALWVSIIITGLIVMVFRLPEHLLRQSVVSKMDELRASGKLNQTLDLEPGREPDGRYTDASLGFSITFPRGWTVKDAISDASIAKKAVYEHPDGRRATIIVYAWDTGPALAWESLTARSLFDQSYGKSGEYLDGGETTLSGQRAIWFKFKFAGNALESYAITYAVLKGNTLFSIFGQTLPGDYQWFEQNEQAIIDSINTFAFG